MLRQSHIHLIKIVFIIFIIATGLGILPIFAQSDVTGTPSTESTEDLPSATPIVTETPLATQESSITETPIDSGNGSIIEDQENIIATITITPEPATQSPEQEPTEPPMINEEDGRGGSSSGSVARGPQVFCQMDIQDLGDDNAFTYGFAAINTSGIASYEWRINGGLVSTAQSFNHTLSSTGTYNIELTCVPSNGSPNLILTGSITISTAPFANFTVHPSTTGTAPFTVYTHNTSTGSGLSFLWEIVEGGFPSYTTPEVSYTFTNPGTYTIRLTVTDTAGTQSVYEQQVAVNAAPPVVDFTVSPVVGTAPLAVTITSTHSGGPVTTWSWDFNGDNIEDANTAGPFNYTYSAVGTYIIKLDYSGPGGFGSKQVAVVVSPDGAALTANFSWSNQGNVPGGVEICFTNESDGPIATNTWNFGDGNIIVDNRSVVCHVYATGGNYTVQLTVANGDNTATAQEQKTINVVGAPIAAFTASMGTIVWGQTVNFDSSPSTGVITSWAWDFNGDGTIDSTQQHPSNVAIGNIGGVTTLGPNTIKLTVTGPGGSSSTEMIIYVERLELTCDFNGALQVMPGATESYTSVIGNIGGRTVTYSWTVSGGSLNANYNTANISQLFTDEGTYVVTLTASTSDGSDCSKTKLITVTYPPLNCAISGNASPLPNGSNYTYTANVSNISGRVMNYDWYVDGVLVQSGPSNTLTRSWIITGTEAIRYEATASWGSGQTASCDETLNVNISYPPLTCSISGTTTPRPTMPSDGGTLSHTYTANVSGVSGRTLSYSWTVNGVPYGANTSSISLDWDWTEIGDTPVIGLTVTATDGINPPTDCNAANLNLTVTLPPMTCNISGDLTPVLNETVSYGRTLSNHFGRPWTNGTSAASTLWYFEQSDGMGGWTPIATGVNGDNYSYTFLTPGTTYRVRYLVSVEEPSELCDTGWRTITVAGTGANFTCDGWFSGNPNPTNPAANYTYRVTMDNTNNINLNFRWVLIDSMGNERLLAETQSTIDGNVSSPAFSGASLGPIGDYTLRVDVSAVNSADSTHTCSLQRSLNVGTFTVSYTYSGTASAVEVGEQICFTNTSGTSHDGINGLNYTWDFGTANNSLNSQTSTEQQPGCISFNAQGTYLVNLIGINPYGTRTGNYQQTFNVWNSQNILINRTDSHIFAGNTLTFTANGTNINTYQWNFYDASNNLVGAANQTGTNISQYFANPGQYRAVVTGTGPLGVTTAQMQFELLGLSDIRAAFTPSQYAGVAPMTVCFTDRSLGTDLRTWEWNFGNGQPTLSYDHNNIPASICTQYTTVGQSFPVTLRVTNALGATAQATNIVRTYTVMESASTFTITPQNSVRYCFSALLAGGATVIGWDFGDGNTGSGQNNICHDFGSTGVYLVTMRIDQNGVLGEIVRTITVSPNPPATPTLTITPSCAADRIATFIVENSGPAMTQPDQAIIQDRYGVVVLTTPFMLSSGQSQIFTANDQSGTVTFSTVDNGANATVNCPYPPTNKGGNGSVSSTTDDDNSTTISDSLTALETLTATAIDNIQADTVMAFAGLPDWSTGAPSCGRNCPTFRLYHTDETGDWEIFRLDGAANGISFKENLSLGERVEDMAPSVSPNNMWMVFSSNRDATEEGPDNWELYVAPVSGGNPEAVQRVTYNITAIDTDPMWGPNNFVVFETTRHGNWDLYMIDMSTGAEYRLTDDIADDINPFWSEDGNRIIFQSARDGQWQIYEINLATRQTRKISDGTSIDVDPVYATNGGQIAFRSYKDQDEASVLMVMDSDGGNRRAITTPEENATNHVWSPSGRYIAYQSDLDGDLDIYVVEVASGAIRKVTDNIINDYAPTWLCSDDRVVFTSDIMGNPDIFEADALPINAPAILLEEDGEQLTFDAFDDIYPQTTPPEENASREGRTALGVFGEQTSFLKPATEHTPIDPSLDGIIREDWPAIESCPLTQ